MWRHALLALLVLCCYVGSTEGRVETLGNRNLEEGSSLSNSIVFLTALDSVIGSTTPSFSVKQTFTLADESVARSSDILPFVTLFYPTVESSRVGYPDAEGLLQLCCTQDLIDQGVCTDDDKGGVIVIPTDEEQDRVIVREFNFQNHTKLSWEEKWNITTSGVYELLYVNCQGAGLGDIQIDGTLTYINPFGQLSAESYPLLWFFGFMFFVLIILCTIWGVLNLIHQKRLISLQHFLSALLLLMMLESLVWFLMLWQINLTGRIHWLWVTATVLTSSVKRTAVGLLYLLISLGYGIMNKARIGTNIRLIVGVIGIYFVVSTAQEMITAYIREGVVQSDYEVLLGFAGLVLLFPSVVIPLGLFWWICACLYKTIQKVKLRKQEAKLELYNKVMVTLIVAAIVTGLMVLMETGISIVDSDQMWRVWWIFTAYWFVMFLAMTVSLLVLFHPVKNEMWLAYTRASTSDDVELGSEIELDNLQNDLNINFDFDLGFDDIAEEESSKIS